MNAPHGALAALLAVLSGVLTSGCRSLESSSYNLRELHEDDGSPRSYNAVMSPAEYFLTGLASGLTGFASLGREALGGEDSVTSGTSDGRRDPTEFVERPRQRALTELLALEGFDTSEPEVWAVQAELGAWLALRSTQPVERLLAVRMLSAVAYQLGEVRPSSARTVLERSVVGADGAGSEAPERGSSVPEGASDTALSDDAPNDTNPSDTNPNDTTPSDTGPNAGPASSTSAALAALWRALDPAAKAGDGAAIRSALAPWTPAQQDLDATRRLLRMTSLLARRTNTGSAQKLLGEAARGYGRQACALGLEAAITDPAPDVARLAATTCTILEPQRAFGLAAAASEGGRFDVVEGIVRGVLEGGLPEGQDDGATRDAWLELFLLHAGIDLGTLPGACFRALAAFAPTDLDTLRIEEWHQWFEQHRADGRNSEGDTSEGKPSEGEDVGVSR